ncbi:hypothetical protein ElyMa_005065400 [Elysia marginata]|uniref:Uncharacterized protein n=1 Tax=Elysia marginata TaxID=1093978 RepID=A0AAV4JEJ7_9GAST|nr:hypothetical protein ElyMa_005065400 [Elysia marginata]
MQRHRMVTIGAATHDGFSRSVRHRFFFTRSNFSIRKIILFMHMWCFDHPQKYMFELEMGEENYTTIVDWCSFMREICTAYLKRHPIESGGINEEDGTPIVVEIDEFKYFHRKYH